jgi:hypothetical protein
MKKEEFDGYELVQGKGNRVWFDAYSTYALINLGVGRISKKTKQSLSLKEYNGRGK